jgi:hypothetical protein
MGKDKGSIDDRTRSDYERGKNDASLPQPERTLREIAHVQHEDNAYWKGTRGEQLDGDKGKGKK